MAQTNLETAKQYLAAIETNLPASALIGFFADDVVREEYPNRLTPHGAKRDLQQILEANERGR